jgi:hypothetical protein
MNTIRKSGKVGKKSSLIIYHKHIYSTSSSIFCMKSYSSLIRISLFHFNQANPQRFKHSPFPLAGFVPRLDLK